MKKRSRIHASFLLAALSACMPALEPFGGREEVISFGVDGLFAAGTKAEPVTSLESFYVSAVTGTAGSEAAAFTSQAFSKVAGSGPARYASGRYWPSTDRGYRFYAANVPLAFTPAGATVEVHSDTDVVVASLPNGTYKGENTLSFTHILARLGNVIVTVPSGTAVSGISIRMTPNLDGTYNIRTGGWSGVTAGGSVIVATAGSAGGSTNSNDIWMVPGNYTLTATWTATPAGGVAVTHTDRTVSVSLPAGRKTDVLVTLDAGIQAVVDVGEFSDDGFAKWRTQARHTAANGYMYAPGNLYWDGTGYAIDNDWEQSVWGGSLHGRTAGSYYHTWSELAEYFDYRGPAIPATAEMSGWSGVVSFGGYDDWFVPNFREYNFGAEGNATVNGELKGHCTVVVSDYYVDGDQLLGMLCFPEGWTLAGAPLSPLPAVLSRRDVDSYCAQGAVFLPFAGTYNNVEDKWWHVNGHENCADYDRGGRGMYWLSSYYSETNARRMEMYLRKDASSSTNDRGSKADKNGENTPVRLVRYCPPVPDKVIRRQPGKDVYIWQDFSPEGKKFSAVIDELDLAAGDYVEVRTAGMGAATANNENLLSFGRYIDLWTPDVDFNWHIYYPADGDRNLLWFWNEARGKFDRGYKFYIADPNDDFFFLFRSEGVTVGRAGAPANPGQVSTNCWTTEEIQWMNTHKVHDFFIGSMEGTGRSHVTYRYIKVHFGS